MFSDILLTVDYDRTMTAPNSTVPERNLEAIRYFIANGGTFTMNTGRSTTTMGRLLQDIPVNAPFLLYNGSAAYENGQLSDLHIIDLPVWETLDAVKAAFPEMNLEVQAVDDHYLVDERPEFVELYDKMHWHHSPAVRGQDMGPFIKFAMYGAVHYPAVSDMFSGTEEEEKRFQALEKFLVDRWGDKVDIFRAAPRIVDVHAKGVSKGNAALQLKQRLGKKILVCVGDAENDITMLNAADYAFCPGDAVIAACYENVCKCADGAVADVIYKKIPEILAVHP